MTYSRRDFGKTALAALPLSMALAAKVNGVTLGVMTYSYRALPQTPGVDRVEAHLSGRRRSGWNTNHSRQALVHWRWFAESDRFRSGDGENPLACGTGGECK